MTQDGDWIVLKFGGTSVATRQRWETIRDIVRARVDEGYRVLVVCSALSGVSNLLTRILQQLDEEADLTESLREFRDRHEHFATSMDADFKTLAGDWNDELGRLVEGTRLIGRLSDEVRARVLSTGEFMSSRIGADWLARQGLQVHWLDARSVLTADPAPVESTQSQRFLSAGCSYGYDPRWAEQFDDFGAPVVVTQGFVAADEHGRTVLLGRGGSDTSAAYFAARLKAVRLEIWTDVPGLFTTNPKDRPDARLLRLLGYAEAQVLSAMGARVLHPRCIPPVRDHDIPLHVRCTQAPWMEGTVISSERTPEAPDVKAVATRHHLYMIDLRCPGHWHLPGLLANVTTVFRRHGVTIDLIANSSQRITVTLDPAVTPLGPIERDNLLRDLESFGEPELHTKIGSVSLVGSNFGSVIRKLADAMGSVGDRGIHMVSQSAHSDGLSFVVDPEDVDRVMNPLHDWLLSGPIPERIFGPSWAELKTQLPPAD